MGQEDSELSLPRKWRLIFWVWCLNCMSAAIIVLFVYYINGPEYIHSAAEIYKKTPPSSQYFLPIKNFFSFFEYLVFNPALVEEIKYRWPGYLLIYIFSRLKMAISYTWKNIIFWTVMILGNYIWAGDHLIFVPVFLAGLTWGWLVFKTRQIWPAVIAHGLANLSIYTFIKIVSSFYPSLLS